MKIIEKQSLCLEAYGSGKLSIANKFAEEIIEELLTLKRVVAISTFLNLIKIKGYPELSFKKNELKLQQLLGGPGSFNEKLILHIDYFKNDKNFLRNYILNREEEDKKYFELSYEYILKNGYDEDIFEKLEATKYKIQKDDEQVSEKNKLNYNYEQVAYELITSVKIPDEVNQLEIIKGLEFDNLETRLEEALEMVTAFRFLSLNKVVVYLCKRLLPQLQNEADIKRKAGLMFIYLESLMELGENHKAIENLEEYLKLEPLYGEEKLAIEYLRAEIYYLLGDKEKSMTYFKLIYLKYPRYRSVNQRLRSLEIG